MDVVFEEKKVKEEKLEVGDIVILDYGYKTCHMIAMEIDGKYQLRSLHGSNYAGRSQSSLENLLDFIQTESTANSYRILSKQDFEIHILPKHK